MANVLSLVPYKIFPPKFGGQKCIAQFNEYFSEYHQLVCLTIKDNPPSAASYEVLNILSGSRMRYINIFYFFLVRRLIKKYAITHLIVEHPYFGWLGLLLKKFCGVRFVIRSHNIEAERFHDLGKWWWQLLRIYEKYVHRHADFTFAITKEDAQYFASTYRLDPEKLAVITFGIPWAVPPELEEEASAKIALMKLYDIEKGTAIYVFNGAFNYGPNVKAVNNIIEVNSILVSKEINYKIIICGKDLPEEITKMLANEGNIVNAGFVNDIGLYLKGADVFINPVTDGGGIKTKLVEALAYNKTAVSTEHGAFGIDPSLCNGKLLVVANDDWQSFADKMLEAAENAATIPQDFYSNFYWDNIARKAADIIENIK